VNGSDHRPTSTWVGTISLKGALKAECRHTVLCRGELPAGCEPHGKRRPGPVEDRPGGHRRTAAARSTLDPSITQPPALVMATPAAHETIAPPEPREVVAARRVRAEPRPQLTNRRRVVSATSSLSHLSLLRSDGEPYPPKRGGAFAPTEASQPQHVKASGPLQPPPEVPRGAEELPLPPKCRRAADRRARRTAPQRPRVRGLRQRHVTPPCEDGAGRNVKWSPRKT
jgi:hypothetical protein